MTLVDWMLFFAAAAIVLILLTAPCSLDMMKGEPE